MGQQKHIVVFSHGFGVRQDSRGTFVCSTTIVPKEYRASLRNLDEQFASNCQWSLGDP